ncbi:hypothetical protein Tco_0973576 [Tanacetum coccineum]
MQILLVLNVENGMFNTDHDACVSRYFERHCSTQPIHVDSGCTKQHDGQSLAFGNLVEKFRDTGRFEENQLLQFLETTETTHQLQICFMAKASPTQAGYGIERLSRKRQIRQIRVKFLFSPLLKNITLQHTIKAEKTNNDQALEWHHFKKRIYQSFLSTGTREIVSLPHCNIDKTDVQFISTDKVMISDGPEISIKNKFFEAMADSAGIEAMQDETSSSSTD